MGRIGCVCCEKIPTWLRATNFCINCTTSPRFAPSFIQLRKDSQCTGTLWNAPKHDLWSNGVDQVLWLRKITTWLRGTNFCINCASSVCFASSFMQLQTIPNATKYCETDRNISLESTRVDLVRSSRKIPTWLRVTNFCINCTSSVCFASSFMQLRNDPKCTEILWNAPKHELRVQWGGSRAFVVKNYKMTSWHELLY